MKGSKKRVKLIISSESMIINTKHGAIILKGILWSIKLLTIDKNTVKSTKTSTSICYITLNKGYLFERNRKSLNEKCMS